MIKNIQKKYTWQERIEFILNYFKKELSNKGIKPSEMALSSHLNISRGKLKAWISGQTPSAEDLEYIVQISTINPLWLFTGEGNHFDKPLPQCDVDLVMIPKVAAGLAAGNGSLETSENILGLYSFRSDWIHRKGNVSQMVLMDVAGDSMLPEIKHGDMVLIDQSKTDILAYRYYAIGVEDAIYVKQLRTKPGQLILHSLNPDFEDIVVDVNIEQTNPVRIIGRVIWWCREAI